MTIKMRGDGSLDRGKSQHRRERGDTETKRVPWIVGKTRLQCREGILVMGIGAEVISAGKGLGKVAGEKGTADL